MKVVIYARVSTDDQNTDMQLLDLRKYAAARGFEIVGEFVDRGFTGKRTSRPELDRLMDGARKRKFDAVMVWKFDRWARSVSHLSRTLDEFRTLGVQFLSYSENFDTSSPMGAAMFAIAAAFAQLEADLIGERTKAALRALKEAGVVLGPKKLGKEAEVVALRNGGASIREIASQLGVSVGYVHSVAKAKASSAV